jgi:hypothetical protein
VYYADPARVSDGSGLGIGSNLQDGHANSGHDNLLCEELWALRVTRCLVTQSGDSINRDCLKFRD